MTFTKAAAVICLCTAAAFSSGCISKTLDRAIDRADDKLQARIVQMEKALERLGDKTADRADESAQKWLTWGERAVVSVLGAWFLLRRGKEFAAKRAVKKASQPPTV